MDLRGDKRLDKRYDPNADFKKVLWDGKLPSVTGGATPFIDTSSFVTGGNNQ